ncbi:hypothetical protein [Roseibium sp.]|uniref:hypothetical protein n=1 Tax=Roseibium sp. TaxID=1936156 RepID=UPI003A97F40C
MPAEPETGHLEWLRNQAAFFRAFFAFFSLVSCLATLAFRSLISFLRSLILDFFDKGPSPFEVSIDWKHSISAFVVTKKSTNETPDLPSSTRIEFVTQFNEAVSFVAIDTDDQLTVFL